LSSTRLYPFPGCESIHKISMATTVSIRELTGLIFTNWSSKFSFFHWSLNNFSWTFLAHFECGGQPIVFTVTQEPLLEVRTTHSQYFTSFLHFSLLFCLFLLGLLCTLIRILNAQFCAFLNRIHEKREKKNLAQNDEFVQKKTSNPNYLWAIYNPFLTLLISSWFFSCEKIKNCQKTIITLCEVLTTWMRIRTCNTDPDFHPFIQCCGSGSGSTGSTCFWASRILLSSYKNSKKNLDSSCFCDFFWT